MKMRIYKEKTEKEIYFKLLQDINNISLYAVNENGTLLSTVLSIKSDGTLYLYEGIAPNIGLKLDERGKIIVKGIYTPKEDQQSI